MSQNVEHHLDPHGQQLVCQYRDLLPTYERLLQLVSDLLSTAIRSKGVELLGFEGRVKTENSLAGKLELKGSKYASVSDVSDVVGLRVITFYAEDVDKVAGIVQQLFTIDWNQSVDKRKLHQLDSFGYNSLHYICRLPATLAADPSMPQLNLLPFELQMRSALQHVWSAIEHDIGYKGAVKLSDEHYRQFRRLAGTMELIDDEFSRLRAVTNDKRRQVQQLVASGRLSEVPLTTDTFRSYLNTHPFDQLNQRIAASNQAEIVPSSLMSYYAVLESFGMTTLGDVEQFVRAHANDAYQLALSQLANTDLDILSESVGLQNLCVVSILKHGGRLEEVVALFDMINGPHTDNRAIAAGIMASAERCSLI